MYCAVNVQEFSAEPGRRWLDGLLVSRDDDDNEMLSCSGSSCSRQFVDVYRWLHPATPQAYTNWCSLTGARATNFGCRLDYIIADVGLVACLASCEILSQVAGSDHCPVRVELRVRVAPAGKCPALCSKYLRQFTGRQQKMSAFWRKHGSVYQSIDCRQCLQCFDAVGWVAGRASGL